MTNLITAGVITLLATNTVTFKTNVTETFNDPSPNAMLTNSMGLVGIDGRYYYSPPPTIKWVIVDVVEERSLNFTYNGLPVSMLKSMSNYSRTITKMKRKEEWEAVK